MINKILFLHNVLSQNRTFATQISQNVSEVECVWRNFSLTIIGRSTIEYVNSISIPKYQYISKNFNATRPTVFYLSGSGNKYEKYKTFCVLSSGKNLIVLPSSYFRRVHWKGENCQAAKIIFQINFIFFLICGPTINNKTKHICLVNKSLSWYLY